MAPAALLDLELLPEEVTLEAIRPPYKYLLVCKVPSSFQQHAAIVLQFTDRPCTAVEAEQGERSQECVCI